MQDNLSLLFAYTDWAHRRILNALASLQDSEEARRLFTHLILCQHRWLERVHGEDTQGRPWFPEGPAYELDQCETEWDASLTRWLDFLDAASEDELNREVEYISYEGPAYRSTVQEIIYQLINHSTHHRAQIARLIREQGQTPPPTDYIFFSRREV